MAEIQDPAQSNGQAEPQPNVYADAFPNLGGGPGTPTGAAPGMKKSWNKNPMSLVGKRMVKQGGQNTVKKSTTIQAADRKHAVTHSGSNGEIIRILKQIMGQTQTTITQNFRRDGSVIVQIGGMDDRQVSNAINRIHGALKSQEKQDVDISKNFHKFILGKGGKQLREIEAKTGTNVRMPGSNDTSCTITITGTKEGIKRAKKEMLDIVQKTGERASEKLAIEKNFHPYIAGGHNKTKQRIEQQCGNVQIHIPPSNKLDATEITVVGEKRAVASAVVMINEIVDKKNKAKIEEVKFVVQKASHRHIIGRRYEGIQDILLRHDVIVEVPPADDPSEEIILRGENKDLGKALTDVYAMAHSHGERHVPCPKWCMSKLIGKGGEGIKQLNPFNETENFVKVTFKDTENEIEILGKTEHIEVVEKNITAEIARLRQQFTVKEIAIPQQFHGRVIGQKGANLIKMKDGREGLNIRVPKNDEQSEIITIEGRPQDVQAVYKDLAVMALDFKNEKEVTLDLEPKYHPYFFRDATGRDKGKKEEFEAIRNQHGDQVNIQFPNRESGEKTVRIRGPREFVDMVAVEVNRLYKKIIEEHYEGNILVAKKFHRNIIGKGGVNINRIKDECNVNIDIPSNDSSTEVIKVIGTKSNVERAKQQIREIENSLAKISEIKVGIPKASYKFLIGQKGANISQLREKYGVAIQFPDEKDKSDQVTIRGEDDQVQAAKKELVAMANEKVENYYTEEIACPKENRKFLVGKNGQTRLNFQKELNVTLSIPEQADAKIQVTGKKNDVQSAMKALAIKIKELNDQKETVTAIAKKYHKRLITDKHLTDLKDEFGCAIQLPNVQSDSDSVTVKGPKSSVDLAVQKLTALIKGFDNESTLEFELKTKDRRALIGEGGITVNNLQATYNVYITIKAKNNGEDQEETTIATLKGPKDQLENVKEELEKLVTHPMDYDLPADYHGLLLGRKGQHVQELSKKLHVTIKVPKKDDENKDVIKIRGTTANLEIAKAELDKLKAGWKDELQQMYLRSYTCPFDVPLIFHSKLIGAKGEMIKKFQTSHDVKIKIEKNDTNITITGLQENVHACVDDISKFVEGLESHVIKDVEIDHAIHNRIVGPKGSKIRGLMKEFKVEIKMPSQNASNYDEIKNIVTVSGENDQVDLCIIELTNLEAEYGGEEGDGEIDPSYVPDVPGQEWMREKVERERNQKKGKQDKKGAKYNAPKDAPWQKENKQGDAFPTLGGQQDGAQKFMGAWGAKNMRR